MAVTKGRLCGQNGCQSVLPKFETLALEKMLSGLPRFARDLGTSFLEDTPIAVLLRQVLGAIAQSVTQRYNCNLRG